MLVKYELVAFWGLQVTLYLSLELDLSLELNVDLDLHHLHRMPLLPPHCF
jgi:hypothetical protein